MYQTSNNYKSKIYEPSTKHLLKVYINDIPVEEKYILDCNFSWQLFSNDEFSLGSVTSQAIELKLYRSVIPDNIYSVYIESGLEEEVVPIGYFNVDNISIDDDYTVTLNLLDNMVKFEFNYDGSILDYPCTLQTVLQDICLKAQVEIR